MKPFPARFSSRAAGSLDLRGGHGTRVWELVFLMVILKIPIVYLCVVVYYAIKAEPNPGGASVTARVAPDDRPRWSRAAARRFRPRPARRPGAHLRAPPRAAHAPPRVGRAMSYDAEPRQPRPAPAETVAGYLASLAIFVSLIGLAWHPLRLIVPVDRRRAGRRGDGGRHSGSPFAAVLIAAACFFLGLTIAVVTGHALW